MELRFVQSAFPGFDKTLHVRQRASVFTEIKNVRQERGPGRRRWFESDGFDLVVWLDGVGALTGFQICYNFGRGEHALTWRPGVGFAHNAVDTGSAGPFSNLTPILVADAVVPWPEVIAQFAARSASLEPELREFVQVRLDAKK